MARRAAATKYYLANKAKVVAKSDQYHKMKRDTLNKLKAGPCTDCGICYDPVCMDFDHKPGVDKVAAVAKLIHHGLAKMLAEVEKCELVCSNCHRLRTKERLGAVRYANS